VRRDPRGARSDVFDNGREHRPEDRVVGALGFGRPDFFEGVAGSTDQKPIWRDRTQFARSHRPRGKMHARRARRERNVHSTIHQKLGPRGIGERNRFADQLAQSPRGKIFFADLDPVDAIREIARDRRQEGAFRRERLPVRDVAPDHVLLHFTRSGGDYDIESMTKQEIILANQQYLFPSVFHYFKEPLVMTRAKDQYVWDIDGNQYLDFFGGIVTIGVGHCNETVNRKVHEQIDKLQHVSTVFANEPQAALAKRIAGITPGGKLTKSFFTNSGTEANETAILTARCYTGSYEIVALRHGYHGRSSMAMAATGNVGSGAWAPAERPASFMRSTPTATAAPSASNIRVLQRPLRAGHRRR
jgi:hypothetical protein